MIYNLVLYNIIMKSVKIRLSEHECHHCFCL